MHSSVWKPFTVENCCLYSLLGFYISRFRERWKLKRRHLYPRNTNYRALFKLCKIILVKGQRIFPLPDILDGTFLVRERGKWISLRSWRDFARKCFYIGSEAVNTSGDAVRGLVKSWVEISLAASPLTNSPADEAREGIWRLRRRSPSHESRQLRKLEMGKKQDRCKGWENLKSFDETVAINSKM